MISHAALSAGEIDLVERSLANHRVHVLGSQLEPAGGSTRVVIQGWIGRSAQLADGRRQILSLFLPGDVIDEVETAAAPLVDIALTQVQTADVSSLARVLERAGPDHHALARAWRLAERQRQARWVGQMLRLGRLSAYERMASLLIELQARLTCCGLATSRVMPLPLTQEMLSDLLGLSTVHINRVLQQLRQQGLIKLRSGQVEFLEPDRLGASASIGRT